MVYMTATPQFIEGVQFKLLGSQGLIGHYPIHFHVCGDAEHKSVVRKNAIVYSKQVCEEVGLKSSVVYASRVHSPSRTLSKTLRGGPVKSFFPLPARLCDSRCL